MPRNGGDGAETQRSKPHSPLRITHDGEFYARLLSKESSLGNPSFRYYGAGPGAVPFVWESHPGTPKDAYSSTTAVVPTITPPPSYHLGAAGVPHGYGSRRHGKASGRVKYCSYKLNKWIKVSFVATVFRRLAFVKSPRSSSSTRWLFSGSGAAEAGDQREYCYDEPPPTTKGMLCLGVRPSTWTLPFWGGGRKEPAGWVYGWRP